MKNISQKYYWDVSFKDNDDKKWQMLLDWSFEIAEYVEFNVLYTNQELTEEIEKLSKFLVEKIKRKNKIYPSGYSMRYKMCNELKEFIQSKKYKDWLNYNFEDISFINSEIEFFATITHENFIIIKMSNNQRKIFNAFGCNFEYEYTK